MREAAFGSMVLVLATAWACGGSDDGSRPATTNGGSTSTSAGGSSTAGSSSAGTTASAGSTASGGSGGSTGAVASKCGSGPFPVSDGSALPIDDFEDGNIDLPKTDSRSSKWFFQTDGSTTGTSTPLPASLLPVDGGANSSGKAFHLEGDQFTTWGVVLGTGLNDAMGGLNCPYDASAYGGISFYAKGSGQIRFAVAESAIYPTSLGGTCVSPTPNDADCFNAHGKLITLAAEWTKVEVPWTDLAQGNWGVKAAFDPKTIMLIEFAATNEQQPFDFWVDEIEFLPPGSTGTGSGGAPGSAGAPGAGGA